jgi:hypothetical protein
MIDGGADETQIPHSAPLRGMTTNESLAGFKCFYHPEAAGVRLLLRRLEVIDEFALVSFGLHGGFGDGADGFDGLRFDARAAAQAEGG